MGGPMARAWQLGMLGRDMVRARRQSGTVIHEQARRQLVERMGSLHGLPQKIGQILSLGELAQSDPTYTPLTEAAATVPAATAFAEIEKHLNRPLWQCFRQIEENGISASIGQVHRAVLLDGRQAAVKFQYPGIAEAIALDLKALGWLSTPVSGVKREFDWQDYQREVGSRLQEELDYRHEAEMMRKFSEFTCSWDTVIIPDVIDHLSGERILTMSWLKGEHFSVARRWPLECRRELSETLLRLFLCSSFRWGYLHADPHPGNYRFLQNDGKGALGLLDFGCVKRLDPRTSDAMADLIEDVIEDRIQDSAERVLARYVEMGFRREMLQPLADRLVPLSRVLFEPFRSPQPFSPSLWKLGDRVADILGPYRWNFRFAGPASLIYLLRAYQGLIEYLKALHAPIRWDQIWEEVRPESPVGRKPDVPSSGLRNPAEESTFLRIRVVENRRTKVDLTFLGHCAEHLPDLMPTELGKKLRQRSIDVNQAASRAVAGNFQPMELFQWEEGNKNVRVWLE